MFVNGMHISPYDHGNIFIRDPLRVKKLLMHKKEIMRPFGHDAAAGPDAHSPSVYFKNGRAKVQVGLCKVKNFTTSATSPPRKKPNATLSAK